MILSNVGAARRISLVDRNRASRHCVDQAAAIVAAVVFAWGVDSKCGSHCAAKGRGDPVVRRVADLVKGAEETEAYSGVDRESLSYLEVILNVGLDNLISLAVTCLPAVLLKAGYRVVEDTLAGGLARL